MFKYKSIIFLNGFAGGAYYSGTHYDDSGISSVYEFTTIDSIYIKKFSSTSFTIANSEGTTSWQVIEFY